MTTTTRAKTTGPVLERLRGGLGPLRALDARTGPPYTGGVMAPSLGLRPIRRRRSRAHEVFEEHPGGAGVVVFGAAAYGLRGRVALVVELDRKTGGLERRREAPDALGLVSFLAAQGQRKPDHESAHLLTTRDRGDPLDIRGEASRSAEGRKRACDAERVIPDRETDAAVADVERKITHVS